MSIKSWIADRWRPLSFGERGEIAATRFLRRQGYRIVVTRRRLSLRRDSTSLRSTAELSCSSK
jgi:hypothetical protein